VSSNCEPEVARWLECVLATGTKNQSTGPRCYNPLGVKNLDPVWMGGWGRPARCCYEAILGATCGHMGEIDEAVHAVLGEHPPAYRTAPHDSHGP